MIRSALAMLAVAACVAGCGSDEAPGRGSLGGIGLFHPAVRGADVEIDVAVMTSFPNKDDDHAERDRRFDWVSLRIGAATAVAAHQSQRVFKTGDLVDTGTGGKSAWRDRWRVVVPAATLARLDGRTPMTVRACDDPPAAGVHCEQRTIDVCVSGGRLRGEVTTRSSGLPAPRGTGGGVRSYANDFSCGSPIFNGGQLTSISDPDPNPDFA